MGFGARRPNFNPGAKRSSADASPLAPASSTVSHRCVDDLLTFGLLDVLQLSFLCAYFGDCCICIIAASMSTHARAFQASQSDEG
jgi:hypothetical protein